MLKRLLATIFLATVCAGSMAACTTVSQQIGREDVALYDEKALLFLEQTFDTAITVAGNLNAAGLITAEKRPAVEAAFEQAYAALKKARDAYDLGGELDAALQTRDAMARVLGLVALLNRIFQEQPVVVIPDETDRPADGPDSV